VTSVSVTYTECVSVALVTQNAKRMRRTVLSSVARLAFYVKRCRIRTLDRTEWVSVVREAKARHRGL
jgi:hypothetical protein